MNMNMNMNREEVDSCIVCRDAMHIFTFFAAAVAAALLSGTGPGPVVAEIGVEAAGGCRVGATPLPASVSAAPVAPVAPEALVALPMSSPPPARGVVVLAAWP